MLRLYNSLTRQKEDFKPLDAANVRLYVCGPTVYDAAHIGNARPVIVFDVLYRLLRHLYGETHVKYVRNITDVDDKIIERARRDFPGLELNAAIKQVTTSTTEQFHADVAALGCLKPDEEPKATDHIEAMKDIIATLVDKGFAYAAEGHVLFRVDRMADYGQLSGRSTDAMLAEARIEAAEFKENPMDFVLWKPSDADQPGWDSPWGRGRPGWHLECSAMARAHLGEVFDIHGGGVDLKFPHHENEIAQSRCAFGTTKMANIWMHNGFLKVEGEKMSKSLGNFVTIRELLEKWPGDVLRFNMLRTHYRKPIDWSHKRIENSHSILSGWREDLINGGMDFLQDANLKIYREYPVSKKIIGVLCDDLNTPKVENELCRLAKILSATDHETFKSFFGSLHFLGILSPEGMREYQRQEEESLVVDPIVERLRSERDKARAAKNFAEADRIRDELLKYGFRVQDGPDGTTLEPVR